MKKREEVEGKERKEILLIPVTVNFLVISPNKNKQRILKIGVFLQRDVYVLSHLKILDRCEKVLM